MIIHGILKSIEHIFTFHILQVADENVASEKRVRHTVILILKRQGDVERFVGRQYFYEVFRHKYMGRVVFNITIPNEKGYAEIPVSPHEFPFYQCFQGHGVHVILSQQHHLRGWRHILNRIYKIAYRIRLHFIRQNIILLCFHTYVLTK